MSIKMLPDVRLCKEAKSIKVIPLWLKVSESVIVKLVHIFEILPERYSNLKNFCSNMKINITSQIDLKISNHPKLAILQQKLPKYGTGCKRKTFLGLFKNVIHFEWRMYRTDIQVNPILVRGFRARHSAVHIAPPLWRGCINNEIQL